MRIGVVSNPLSQRNRRGLAPFRAELARYPAVLHAELDKIADIGPILAEFARREIDLIVVNGGDGTVQAVLTALLEAGPFESLPCLAVLPSGMTNLIALDVGLKGRPDRALARLLASDGRGERVTRRTLVMTVHAEEGRRPVHGMFFGAGAFYRATMLGREKIHPLGVERSAAAGMTLGLFLLRLLLRGKPDDRLVRDDIRDLRLDGESLGGRHFIALATTLDRLLLGLWPFWNGGGEAFRYTAAPFPPERLGRALLPLLRGRPRRWMAGSGYVSGAADRLSFTTAEPVVLDGEIFVPEPNVPVVLTKGRPVEFLRC